MKLRSALLALPLLLAACGGSDPFASDGGGDGSLAIDGGGGGDGGSATDGGGGGDGGSATDGGGPGDGGSATDGGGGGDGGKEGGSLLGPPCTRGPGFVAWKFHYNGSTSALTDVYSLPDSSNWTAVPAYSTSFVDAIHGGGIQIGGGNWILIRFSVVGLTQIKSATLSVYGRSYSTTTSGSFEAWSPLYGSIYSGTNSISNAWPYQWKSVDYTANVKVGDAPGLTGIRLYAGPNSNVLVINTVELCIDGS